MVLKNQQNAGSLATVGYGTALGIIRTAAKEDKCIQIIATETRPALQGARLTTYELIIDGFCVTLIADTMVGYVMQNEIIDKVIVGADRITKTGHLFNKIGTYQIAVLAMKHNIPFYCAAPNSTFDLKSDYKEVVIEQRNINEVIRIGDKRLVFKKTRILNPAFDITPPELVTAIITENGIIEPEFEKTIPQIVNI